MIEILIVIAGAASAGGWGSLAWWTSTRHHDRRAVVLASRTVGCHPRGPKSAVRATWRTQEGPRSKVRVIEGEIVSEVIAAPSSSAGPRATGGGQACHGRTILHEDGSVTCYGGRDDCWPGLPGSAYRHSRSPEACAAQSHGCGVCQTVGGAS